MNDDDAGGIIDDRPAAKGHSKAATKNKRGPADDESEFCSDKRPRARPNKYMNPNHRADVPFYYTRKRVKKKDQQTRLFKKEGKKGSKK